MARWQRGGLAAVAVALPLSLFADPDATAMLIMALLTPVFLCVAMLRAAAIAAPRRPARPFQCPIRQPESEWHYPVYSILVPLYREAHMAPALVAALDRLDWPASRRDILIITEADDAETRAAFQSVIANRPGMRVLTVPPGTPRTKPRALMYALPEAVGDFIVVYDAEDEPESDQLQRAYRRFRSAGPGLGCLQAHLNIYNCETSWITRQFTLEYTALFDAILPTVERLRLPMPLGGTSNHFPGTRSNSPSWCVCYAIPHLWHKMHWRPLLAHAYRKPMSEIVKLNDRSRAILRQIVESYLSTGDPVGSRNLSRVLPLHLSPASIRNVMADLEELGLIYAPHTSAGRLPTQTGLRMFVDGLLETGALTEDERRQIEAQIAASRSTSLDKVLGEAGEMISGLSHCAGVVLAEKQVARLKQVEFVPLEPTKALAILVSEDGDVENRIINLPPDVSATALIEAANYLNAHIRGLTIGEARQRIESELANARAELDGLTQKVVTAGLAEWSGALDDRQSLIVRGQSNLLKDLTAIEDLERIRQLFDDLESKKELSQILGLAEGGEGVRIFIGSENKLFSMSGSSLIVAPFHNHSRKVVGVLGVIGPTRLNYARIIPMVDYTAKIISRLIS